LLEVHHPTDCQQHCQEMSTGFLWPVFNFSSAGGRVVDHNILSPSSRLVGDSQHEHACAILQQHASNTLSPQFGSATGCLHRCRAPAAPVMMLRAHACSNRIPASYKSPVLQAKSSLPDLHSSSQHTMSTAPFLNEYFTSQCPASAPFFSFMGAAIALVFSSESSFLSQLTWSLTSFSQTLAPLTAHPKLALAS
jgi:hypothetical protein